MRFGNIQKPGLARALRAAVILPLLLAAALLLIKEPQVAGFAAFGTFAHLVMISYDPSGRTRFLDFATFTLLGGAMVGLGTVASDFTMIWRSPPLPATAG